MAVADDILFAPIGGGKGDIYIPTIWTTVLNRIRQQPGWSDAAIAGGCLRDLDNGRPVKDVDIFVHFTDNETTSKYLHSVVTGFHKPSLHEVEHDSCNTSQVGQEGISHFKFQQDGWLFEISQVINPFDYQTLLDGFDIGLCMIGFDGKTIYRAPEYKADAANREIKIVRPTGGKELDHAHRILKKYSGWKVVDL